jgi:DNA polymerase lambda
VDCYEDLKEEMKREEVELIGKLVEERTQQLYPGAEVRIMGSYRRGKEGCGDVDVHITHKLYVKTIPETALGEIVDALWKSGYVVYHLTFLPGMQTGSKLTDYQTSSKFLQKDVWTWSKVKKYGTSETSSSSYMGVFHSPTKKGRRRRVDIKFYPYRERVFASLYFTGNGYFNRSMRLWSARKFNLTLNDHGLFSRGTVDRVMEASEESEVFDKLQLAYKEPIERDSFDAVEPLEGEEASADMDISEAEFYGDDKHVWVE